jgi:hypothetical protein
VKRESVNLNNEEAVQEEVNPPDARQEHLRFKADAVGPEQVLRIDFHNRLGAQVQLAKGPQNGRGPVSMELVLQEVPRHAVKPDGRRGKGGGRRRRQAAETVQYDVLHCGEGLQLV